MTDQAVLPESAEPREVPPGPDKLLSWVCALRLLNALTGAVVVIREDLPGELIAGVFVGRDASAEFFKGPGTALSRSFCQAYSPRSPVASDEVYSPSNRLAMTMLVGAYPVFS
jgi:hypothetical protein